MEISSLRVAEAEWTMFVEAAPPAALIVDTLTSHHPQDPWVVHVKVPFGGKALRLSNFRMVSASVSAPD